MMKHFLNQRAEGLDEGGGVQKKGQTQSEGGCRDRRAKWWRCPLCSSPRRGRKRRAWPNQGPVQGSSVDRQRRLTGQMVAAEKRGCRFLRGPPGRWGRAWGRSHALGWGGSHVGDRGCV